MKENVYDEQQFFDSYSQMLRSQQGLRGAGEWPALQQMFPDVEEKTVLDLGCGYGWHCLYAAEKGAKQVIGVDLSEKMLAVAQEKTTDSRITYIHESIEEIDFADETFDVIFSSLAFHYVADFATLVVKMQRMLNPGGQLLFSVEHPVFTAQGRQDWIYDEKGEIAHFPVDRYFEEGVRTAHFLGADVTKYHRTLTSYLDSLITNGFQIQRVVEPTPPASMPDEFRRPMMLLIAATKK